MLQYSYYATITPEGCASILFKNSDKKMEAAEIMGITAERLLGLGLIDGIIPEPLGGAHRDIEKMSSTLKAHLITSLQLIKSIPKDKLVEQRYKRLMALGES
jgi:acetyl-CoA carboxylase carboxyl transferase subunit alpha